MNLELRLRYLLQSGKRLCITALIFLCLPVSIARAQIESDGSLPTNVEELRDLLMEISGGEQAGDNLFHSFEEFSVQEGAEASFQNAADIENIFARVTGDAASLIDGTISANGDANLFLINDNGIVFGDNASLNIGGSFIGTTADSLLFEDGSEFSTNDTENNSPLTVSVPIGLGFGSDSLTGASGSITVNGDGNQIESDSRFTPIGTEGIPTGLSVKPEHNLALIGGDVEFNGGIVTAEGSKIEVGSVKDGVVNLQEVESGLQFNYENVTNYQNILLTEQALINTSGKGAGNISLTGNEVSLSNGSFLLNQNQGDTNSGTINVDALESLSLSGTSPNSEVSSSIRSESLSTGQASNIDVTTPQLSVLDNAQIRTGTYSEASGNNISVDVSNSIDLVGGTISNSSFAEGKAGSLQVKTSQINAEKGGGLVSATTGTGDGGDITVNADSINLTGTTPSNRSTISVSTFNTGKAGDLNIETKQLQLREGATVSSTSFANGDAGNLNVDASESIIVKGAAEFFNPGSNPNSSIRSAVQTTSASAQESLGLPSVPGGNAGNLTIDTPSLTLVQQGNATVENQGTGNAGTLTVNANDISLDESGSITAATASGQGGNIDLDTDTLQIDNQSGITATAENQGGGGNVTINATNILAKKNSTVSANAEGGDGGNITIDTINLLLDAPVKDVFSASSKLGIDGTVEIETNPDFQGSFELVVPDFAVADKALEDSCFESRNQSQGSFVYGGTGGLPVSPDSTIDEEESYSSRLSQVEPDLPQPNSLEESSPPAPKQWQIGDPIVEPTDLIKTKDGRLLWVNREVNKDSLVCQ